jgi:hypothetical protein
VRKPITMIRARSPLFPITYLFACMLGVGAGVWQFGSERLATLGLVFVGLSFPLLLLIGVVEWRIYHGWEPFWLRRLHPEVRVVGKYRDEADLPGHQRVEMAFPDGSLECFILDLDELGLCSKGDLVHLWAIGKHVSHIVVIEPGKALVGSWCSRENSGDGCAQFLMWTLPLVSSGVMGAGFGMLSQGTASGEFGWGMVLSGGLVAIGLGYVWLRGWKVERGAISDPVGEAGGEVGCCLLELLSRLPFWFW